ncbi:MAG: CocE/NonD family hydrolase C-terminal non-catalytic domain-containing protein, partial [Anaerolineales bacterium]
AGLWCPYGQAIDFPTDQSADDGLSLTFNSAPIEETMDILGFPEVTLTLAADQPNALIVVRLCDVSPTGESLLISRGFLNLTHRDSFEHPEPLEPGEFYRVNVRLDVAGHRLPAGHRWRLSVSPTYWPMAWPSPEVVTLRLQLGAGSQLRLPLRPSKASDAVLPEFGPPEESQPIPHVRIEPGRRERHIAHDVANKKHTIHDVADNGRMALLDNGLEMYGVSEEFYTIYEDQPLSANLVCEQHLGLRRGEWEVRAETYSEMSADEQNFHVINVISAFEGDVRVFSKTWHKTIPRHLV